MKLSVFKTQLAQLTDLVFALPDGTKIPSHYHVTEVGQITKNFIDCGGVLRNEQVVNFQLWYADDIDHRLQAQKMVQIIDIAEKKLGLQDAEIEVEYQSQTTIGKYGLSFKGDHFQLTSKATACLASSECGVAIPIAEGKITTGCC